MKKQIFLLAFSAFLGLSVHAAVNVQAVRIGESNPSVSAYVFGTGEQLSGQQFQTDGILTYQGISIHRVLQFKSQCMHS